MNATEEYCSVQIPVVVFVVLSQGRSVFVIFCCENLFGLFGKKFVFQLALSLSLRVSVSSPLRVRVGTRCKSLVSVDCIIGLATFVYVSWFRSQKIVTHERKRCFDTVCRSCRCLQLLLQYVLQLSFDEVEIFFTSIYPIACDFRVVLLVSFWGTPTML